MSVERQKNHPVYYGAYRPECDNNGINMFVFMLFLDEDCKKRWRLIRDHFKCLKREGKLGTGSAARKPVNWLLLKYVSFLSQVPEERR